MLSFTPRLFRPHERLQTRRCQQKLSQRAARASDDSKPGCICQFISLNVLILRYPQDPKSPNATRYAAAEMAIDKVENKVAIDLIGTSVNILLHADVNRPLTLNAAVCSPLPAR